MGCCDLDPLSPVGMRLLSLVPMSRTLRTSLSVLPPIPAQPWLPLILQTSLDLWLLCPKWKSSLYISLGLWQSLLLSGPHSKVDFQAAWHVRQEQYTREKHSDSKTQMSLCKYFTCVLAVGEAQSPTNEREAVVTSLGAFCLSLGN